MGITLKRETKELTVSRDSSENDFGAFVTFQKLKKDQIIITFNYYAGLFKRDKMFARNFTIPNISLIEFARDLFGFIKSIGGTENPEIKVEGLIFSVYKLPSTYALEFGFWADDLRARRYSRSIQFTADEFNKFIVELYDFAKT